MDQEEGTYVSGRWGGLKFAFASNATDAAATQLASVTLDLVAVAVLGFTATQLGLLNALSMVSFLVLTIPIGIVVDRLGPVRVLAASIATKVVLVALLAILVWAGQLSIPLAMTFGLVLGAVSTTTETAQTTVVPSLVADDRIARTIATMTSADRAASIAAPATAGFLVHFAHGVPSFAASTLLLGVALATAVGLRRYVHDRGPSPEEPAPITTPRCGLTDRLRTFASTAGHGFVVLYRTRVLLGVTILVAATNIGLALSDSVVTIVILRELHLGTVYYGILGTIGAITGLCAAAVAPRVVHLLPIKRMFTLVSAIQAVITWLPLTALIFSPGARVIFAVFTISWSLVVTIANIAGFSYVAANVPKESLGRTSAAERMITMGAIPFAALGGGVLADHFGLAVPLIIWPLITLLAALGFWILARGSVAAQNRESVPEPGC